MTAHLPTGDKSQPYSRATSVENEGAAPSFSLKARLLNVRTLMSISLGVVIIVFVVRGFNIGLGTILTQARQINIWLYLLAFPVFYLTFPIRAFRWQRLLRNAGFPIPTERGSWASVPALTEYIGLGWFVNCIIPAKLGDAYRSYLLKRNGGVSFSRATGTVVAERLLDMLVLFPLLALSGWSVFGTRLPPAARYAVLFGLFLTVLIVVGLAAMRFLSSSIRRVLPGDLAGVYGAFEAGTLSSLRPRSLPLLFGLTALVWLCESLRLFLVVAAIGEVSLPLPTIIFVALLGSLLTAVPVTPGGIGVAEGGIIAILHSNLIGVTVGIAGTVALFDRVINYWSVAVFGLLLYLCSKRK